MTTMKAEDLIDLGFNKNEAKVYLTLIRFRKADAREIIKATKFHKNIVYDNLGKLLDKGLISHIIEGNRKVFQISSSHSLIDFFNEKKKELDEKKKKAEKISKEINTISKSLPQRQEATIFRGIKAIKNFYYETLKQGDYVVFGAPQESIDIMGETFWHNHNIKRINKKITVRMIFNPSIRYHGKELINKYTKIRYFERDFEPLTETHIQGDIIAIIVWTQEPLLFLIQDKYVADAYLRFFEKIWKQAKS